MVLCPHCRPWLFLQNTPFARPKLDDLLSGLKFIMSKAYPVRGTA
jgi:hypothetical protein